MRDKLQQAKAFHRQGNFKQAAILYQEIVRADPTHAAALHGLGLIAHQSGEVESALSLISAATKFQPDEPKFHFDLGVVCSEAGYVEKAKSAYCRVLNQQAHHVDALNNLGLILFEEGCLDEALSLFESAVKIDPHMSKAHYNRGMTFLAQGKPQAAIQAFDQTLKIAPKSKSTRFNRALALLTTGSYLEGWAEYEHRFRGIRPDGFELAGGTIPLKKRWQGQPFPGKRLWVHDEQGLGDTLQFIRYFPMVKQRGGEVVFETKAPLVPLLKNFDGIDRVERRSANPEILASSDYFIPLMSLPALFKTTLETIPSRFPYLRPDPAKSLWWKNRLRGNGLKVGLVWAGRSPQTYDRSRSAGMDRIGLSWAGKPLSKIARSRPKHLSQFSPLAAIPGIRWYGLQKGSAGAQADFPPVGMSIENLNRHLKDFTDTAAIIANLDLVISVDTAVVHLAGMMAKPVWVVLSAVADWRWLQDREDSPWYPSARLFRQKSGEGWESVFARIAGKLEQFAANHTIPDGSGVDSCNE